MGMEGVWGQSKEHYYDDAIIKAHAIQFNQFEMFTSVHLCCWVFVQSKWFAANCSNGTAMRVNWYFTYVFVAEKHTPGTVVY